MESNPKSEGQTQQRVRIRLRLTVTIPVTVFILSFAAGLFALNLSRSPQRALLGPLPIELLLVIFSLFAAGAGFLLAYSITAPLGRAFTEPLARSGSRLSAYFPRSEAPNEAVAASEYLARALEVMQNLAQDHDSLNALTEGLITLDSDGRVASLNAYAADVLEMGTSSLTGKPLEEVIPRTEPNRAFHRLVQEMLEGKVEFGPAPLSCTTRTGKRYLLVTSLRQPYAAGVGGLISFRDLQSASEVQLLIREAELFMIYGNLVGELAHELRNPLTSIQGYAQLLLRAVDKDSPNAPYVATISEQAERVVKLSNRLLEFGRSSVAEFQLCPVDSLLKAALEGHRFVLTEKNVRIDLEQKTSPNDHLLVDKEKMLQALGNILSNAFDYTPEGGTIKITSEKTDGRVRIQVTNTGSFIPPDKLQKIFAPFYSTRAGGTGLGLTLSERVIRAQGGAIKVESDEKIGTAFIIELPAYELAGAPALEET